MIRIQMQWLLAIPAVATSLQFCLPAHANSYARDMFYQELKAPTAAPAAFSGGHAHHATASVSGGGGHSGLSFWIELQRNGKTSKTDSRMRFRGGDKVKFHVVSNIDGYAHVVMLQGSSGAQAVLFPVAGKDPTNHMVRGKEYAIPSVTWLVFDNTPGREHVRIALTKRDEDPAKFLQPQAAAQFAMATISPNPAIDPSNGKEQIKVSFKEDIPKPVPIVRPAVGKPPSAVHEAPVAQAPVTPPSNDTAIANAIPDEDSSKDMFREDSGPGHSSRPAVHHAAVHHRPSHTSYHPSYHPSYAASSYRPPSVYTPPPPPPTTVVLNTNANEDLYADISLEHD